MGKSLRPLLALGTRPEAIKMAPVIDVCRKRADVEPIVCFTGQHVEMVAPVAEYFDLQADVDLKVMRPGQSLAALTGRLLEGFDAAIERFTPDCVVAQGDTTSTFVASLAAFYRKLPFVHVEAGLRTGDIWSPWPEEFNRRAAGLTTTLHCAPTTTSQVALLREGIPAADVRVTGNTVIDALLVAVERERRRDAEHLANFPRLRDRTMVLVTAHRRENHGAALASILAAVRRLATMRPELEIVFPVHLHPQVQAQARDALAGLVNVALIEPSPYPEFVWLMGRAKLILSDSGGVQEEAPSLRTPVLVLRESTERPESLAVGATKLVGADTERITRESLRLLDDPEAYRSMQVDQNPYGDGRTAERIVNWMRERFSP